MASSRLPSPPPRSAEGSARVRAARRRMAGAALATTAALLGAGCSATNPMTTADSYAASDGTAVELGDLRLGNLIVLSAASDGPGTLLGSVTNDGGEDDELSLAFAGSTDPAASIQVSVPAGETVMLRPDGETPVDLSAVPAAPGAFVALVVSSSRAGSTTVQVPVLDGTLPEYADLVP